MTIYEIKKRLGTSSNYFDKATMQVFGQTLRDFKVKKINKIQYLVYAPSYWNGVLMGMSQQIYDVDANTLCDVPDSLKIKGEKR